MTDDAGSYSSGVGGGGGGNDWEIVSLTASTYAAAPGPVLPLLLDARKKTELPPAPPAAASAVFMSQHFSLPAAGEAHSNIINGCQEEEEEEENSAPATLPRDDEGDTDDLNMPCPENSVREQEGTGSMTCSDFHKNLSTTLGLDDGDLFAEGGEGVPVCFAGEERQATTLCSSAAADAATADGIIDSAILPAHVVHVAVHSAQGVARVAPNQDGGSMTRRSDFHKDQSTTMGLDDGDLFADAGNALPLQGGDVGVPACFAGEERQATMLCSSAAADAATADGIIDSAFLPAHVVHAAVPSGSGAACVVAPNRGHSSSIIPCEARAWWNKTFRFLRDNSKESLTFRFILVAATIVGLATLGQRGKLQLRLEFNVDSEKISCGVSEPLALGQVKVSMLAGSPVAQG